MRKIVYKWCKITVIWMINMCVEIEMKIQDSFNYEYVDFNISLSELDNGILSLTAMLNKNGKGKVYFGVNKDGTIVGLEESTTQETIREIG